MKVSDLLKNHAVRILLATALLLLLPFTVMQFSDELNWGFRDFSFVGALFVSAGLVYELLTTKLDKKYRLAVTICVIGTVLLIWGELAVGIFGTPFAGS